MEITIETNCIWSSIAMPTLGSTSLLSKTKYSHLQPFKEGPAQNSHGSHIVLILLIRLLGVGDPCVR